MDRWQAIREAALERRREVVGDDPAPMTGAALLDAAFRQFGIDVENFDGDSMFGPGIVGCIMPKAPMCFIARWLPEAERAAVLAHELGHFTLHADDRVQTKFQVRDGTRTGGLEGGYSPQELKERQADVFAREFLCPSRWLREELATGDTPDAVARRLAIPVDIVTDQAVAGLLLDPGGGLPTRVRPVHMCSGPLLRAASWAGGHLLARGGPGSGKSTALVARLLHLLDGGTPASAIALVTASDHAAVDLRRRLPATLACELRIGTLRSLALDLARRWPIPLGRRFNPTVIDRVDALAVLGDACRQVGVAADHGLLARTLREMAGAEARGSGTPARSRHGAMSLPEAAFAAVGAAYEGSLRKLNAFDAAGAIRAATTLVRTVAPVQVECRARLVEVLVDDAEDLTPSGVELLVALCAVNTRLWATACADVAVNRFNGSNFDAAAELAGSVALTTVDLHGNQRASGAALAAFDRVSRASGGRWSTSIGCSAGATLEGEADAIAANIERARQAGIVHGDQVVLARSHLTLRRLAPKLRERGVPLVDFGDLAARSEVEALLATLAEPSDGPDQFAAVGPGLRRWLFDEAGLSQLLPEGQDGVDGQVARLVIHHVLSIATEHDASLHRSAMHFRERVAHAGSLDQDTAFRKETLDASALDAVRIMTIHACKGLEFGAVHLAGMSRGYMPVTRAADAERRRVRGSGSLDPLRDEEDALLLIALSRARKLTFLTRAERYAGRRSGPSPYLSALGAWAR